MELSNEERLRLYHLGMVRFRAKAEALLEHTNGDTDREVIEGWLRKIDLMVGKMIATGDSTKRYWIMGSPHTYSSLFSEPFYLDGHNSYQDFEKEYERVLRDLGPRDFTDFVWRICERSQVWEEKECLALAAWWDMEIHFANLMYPIDRYDDGLFSPIKDDFLTLIGEMANYRYRIPDLCTEALTDLDERVNLETRILCKWDMYHTLVEEMARPLRDKHFDECRDNKGYGPISSEIMKTFRDGEAAIFDRVLHASLAEVRKYLEEEQRKKYEREGSLDTCKGHVDFDGWSGPDPRSEEELHEIRQSDDVDEETYEKARRDLEVYYNTYVTSWENLQEKKKRKTKKK